MLEELEQAHRSQRPQVRYRSELAPVVLHGDRALVRSAVGNVLDNAAKGSSAGGTVEVGLGARSDRP